jgi:hemerythrin-like domain-containing protein
MLPIGLLMEEHRVIEKLIARIGLAADAGRREGRIDLRFVEMALDFLRTYADRCHHGKEEGILFRALERKSMAAGHRATMAELIEEHRIGRQKVRELGEAAEAYGRGEGAALHVILDRLEFLAAFYPVHIRKEDRAFFLPVMDYFDEGEKAAMIAEEMEFDRKLIHELYREKVEEAAKGKAK